MRNFILFTLWHTIFKIKLDLIISQEPTLNNVVPNIYWFEDFFKKISILHECKESRYLDKLLRVKSTQLKFDKKGIEEKSIMNPFYEDDTENRFQ